MCSLVIYYIFIIYFGHSLAKKVTYEGAQVWRTELRSPVDVEAFQKLAQSKVLSIWALKWNVADYLVQAKNQKKLKLALETGGLKYTVLIADVQKAIDDLKEPAPEWNETTLRLGHRLTWTSYPRLDVINEYLNFLAKSFPEICSLTTIGYSIENRPIKMLRISNGHPRNQAIMITAGIHAREWISITSALYLMHDIVMNFDQQPNYVKYMDWKIVPVLNPDGYEYSHTHDRLWRKNRRQLSSNECMGVDLNRNFGHAWYIHGLSQNCCSCHLQYPGTQEFSEPEAQAIRDYVLRNGKPHAFVDIHSYGQLILHPWGHSAEAPSNGPLLSSVADKMSQAIKASTGRNYIFGNTFHTVYQAAGIQSDWFFSLGVELSYTIEMRDSLWGENNNEDYRVWSANGFLVPPDLIKPTGEDLVAAMKKLTRTMGEARYTSTRPINNTADIILGLSLSIT